MKIILIQSYSICWYVASSNLKQGKQKYIPEL